MAALQAGDPDTDGLLRESLRDYGAALLVLRDWGDGGPNLKLSHALEDGLILARVGSLAQEPLPAAVHVVPGRERRLDYSLHDNFAGSLSRVERSLAHGYCELSAMGRIILHALGGGSADVPLETLMEGPVVKEYDVGCSVLSVCRHCPSDGHALDAAAGLTAGGLLTLIHSPQPGLEVRTRGGHDAATTWFELQGREDTVIILAGEALAAASGGAYPAAVYRVVAQPEPRCSVALELRAAPGAALTCAPGGTVAGFEAQSRVPPEDVDLAACGAVAAVCSSEHVLDSASDVVFQTPLLAELIAECLAMDPYDDGCALARASLLCRGMRDAVSRRWPLLCKRLHMSHRKSLVFPPELSMTTLDDAQRWRRLYRSALRKTTKMYCKVRQLGTADVHFQVRLCTTLGRVRCFAAACGLRIAAVALMPRPSCRILRRSSLMLTARKSACRAISFFSSSTASWSRTI